MADEQVKYVISIKDDGSASIKNMTRNLNELKNNLKDTGQGADSTGPSFLKLASSFTAGGLAVNAITGALNLATGALSSIGSGLISAGKSAVDLAGKFEMTKVSFSVLTGNTEKATKLLGDLTDFAKKTPFTLTGVEDASRQLLAYGVNADDMVGTLTNLGQIASGTNVPIEQMANTYGQVMVKGKLAGQEVLQFFNAGVPITQLLADNMGITTGEVEDLVSKGEIGFPKVQEVLQGLTAEGGKFNGMFDQANGTFQQMSSNLADSVNVYLRELGTILLPVVKDAINLIQPAVFALGDFLKKELPIWIAKFKEVGEYLWDTWQPSISQVWETIKKDWKLVYDALAPALGKLFDEFFKLSGEVGVHQIGSFSSFIDVVARTIAIIGPPIVDVIRILLPILAAMATAIYDLYIEFEKAIKWIQDFILTNETIKKWKEDVASAIDGAIKWLNDLSLAWIKTKDAINNNPITQIINKVVQTVTKKEGGYVGFADGGFTAGKVDDIAGAVHGGEWVAPAWMVNAMPSLFGNLESARQGNTYNQPITVNANIQDNTDFRLLMNELAFNLRS